jgi:MFS family permease
MPTLIKQLGIDNPVQIGWLTTIPYVVAIVAMIIVNISADKHAERRWHTAIPCFIAALGLVISGTPGLGLVITMFGLTLAAAGASTSQASFWSLPPMFLTGAAAAAGIALVNSLGNIAGMASTGLVGWMTDLTGSPNSALYLFAVFALIGGLMVLRLPAETVNR